MVRKIFGSKTGVIFLIIFLVWSCSQGKEEPPQKAETPQKTEELPEPTDVKFSVTDTIPQGNQENISPDISILIKFNMGVNKDSVKNAFKLIPQGGSASVDFSVSPFMGPDGEVASALSIVPSAPLNPETVYTASVSTEAKSAEGIPLASGHNWSFKTGQVIESEKPVVTSTVPSNNATGAYEAFAIINFSEAIDWDHLKNTPSQLVLSPTATIQNITPAVNNKWATITFNPKLTNSTHYTATLKKEAVKDAVGNYMESDYVWSFTTQPCGSGKGQTPCPEPIPPPVPDCGTGKGQSPCPEVAPDAS